MKRFAVMVMLSLIVLTSPFTMGCLQAEKDEHGCLVGQNYTWCPIENRCVKRGEEICPLTTNITSFEECVAAGYPVMESYPRQCRVPGLPTFVEDIMPQLCREAGGNWNECSSKCRLDNAGKPNVVCVTVCDRLCECGGIASFKCPMGYTCKTPIGIPNALGYCILE